MIASVPLLDEDGLSTAASETVFESQRGSRRRRLRQVILESRLRDFLDAYSFKDVNDSRKLSHGGSQIYPIHIAANMGDETMVRLLLREGADSSKVFRGRTACDMAEDANVNGSHVGVVALLKAGTKIVPAQALMAKVSLGTVGTLEIPDLKGDTTKSPEGRFWIRHPIKTALSSLRR